MPNDQRKILHDKRKRPRGVADAYLSAKEEDQAHCRSRMRSNLCEAYSLSHDSGQILARKPFLRSPRSIKVMQRAFNPLNGAQYLAGGPTISHLDAGHGVLVAFDPVKVAERVQTPLAGPDILEGL